MNKKGFTLVELLGVIAVLAIVGGMVVVSMTGVIGTGKKTAYESYEKTFELSVQNYLTDYPDEEPTEDYSTKIYLKEMIAKGYIEDYKDSNGGNCNDASNNSYVLVTKPYNVSGVSNDYQLEYKTCLICKNGSGETYKSTNCSNSSDGIIYLISYNLNGGTAGNPTKYSSNTNTFTLNQPTKIGYTFIGWTGSNGSTPQVNVTITKGSTGDKTYTANWELAPYTITYTLNGGVLNNPKTSYKSNENDFTLKIPTKNGYTFGGWTGSNGSTPQVNVTITKGSTGDRSYTANWNKTTYTISYNLNGGTNSSENPSSYNIETETFTLKAPTKTGYTFSGWTGSNGTTPQTSVKITKGTTGNKNYTANWNPITYKVKYNGNGATSGSMENSIHTYDVAKNLNANNYTKAYTVSYNYDNATGGNSISSNTGTYTFSGWAETASGDKKYDNLASVKNLSSTNNATVNLYAKWTVGTVKLPTPTKTNYKFVGWYSNASKTAFVGNGGDNYSPTSNITLYAKWVLKTTTFYYTGGVQSYTAPITGTYKLEVWGAQGGTDGYSENCTGGKGGYSYGNIYLNANTTIYIVVGGKGSMEYKHFSEGGYNGGGSAFCNSRGEYGDFDQHVAISGGGATHIATTNRGELKNYKSYVNELKIVAGGGGANAYPSYHYPCLPGGDGGGTKGTDGVSVTSVQYDFRNLRAHGGTQYEPGYYSYSSISSNSPCYKHSHYNYYCSGGNFGLGADGNYVGGGGGLYGGGVAFVSAGGGSGYIGGVSSGGMINGQRSGDGLANITIQ